MADDTVGGSWQGSGQGDQRPPSPEEAEQQLLRNLAALGGDEPPRRRRERRERAPEEPTYSEPLEAGQDAYSPSYAYDAAPAHDSGRARGRRSGRVSRIIVRFVAPLIFLGAVIAIVSIVMNSGVMNGGDGAGVSPSPSKSAHASPGTTVKVRVYKVRSGDTLSVIAERSGTTVDAILAINPGLNANDLTVGSKIKLPAKQ
jgi:hypothetical protein